MNIYVMRHGTTVYNEKKITQGRTNNRLSKNGIALVKCTAEKSKNVKFDIIYSSPLMRTMQTSNLMNAYHKVKIIKDERLIEIDQGIFSKRSKKSLTEEEKLLKAKRAKECGMESFEECFYRAKDFCDNVLFKSTFKNILIVTHNCMATLILEYLKNPLLCFSDKTKILDFDNAELKKFII